MFLTSLSMDRRWSVKSFRGGMGLNSYASSPPKFASVESSMSGDSLQCWGLIEHDLKRLCETMGKAEQHFEAQRKAALGSPHSEASRMLEAALQQMDGIISGRYHRRCGRTRDTRSIME
ncbi:uncharacterized protein [Anabrus simplex]|uniref:uncharacterized protein isoform X2 n=1 Tax=Anabrus simplex TaxID=316456 RepID=UPI0035A29180